METNELVVKLLNAIGSEKQLNDNIKACEQDVLVSDSVKIYFREYKVECQNSGELNRARFFENVEEHCKLLQEIGKLKLEFYSFKKDLFDILSNYKEN